MLRSIKAPCPVCKAVVVPTLSGNCTCVNMHGQPSNLGAELADEELDAALERIAEYALLPS